MSTEYGVEYKHADGRTFVAGGYSLAAARRAVAADASWAPRPVRVMSRQVGEWQPLEAEAASA